MQIKYKGKNEFIIKAKKVSVRTGKKVFIGDYLVGGVGEYENEGIEARVLSGGVYIFSKDSVSALWLAQSETFPKVLGKNNLDNIEVIMLAVGKQAVAAEVAKQTLSVIEPKVAIFSDAGGLKEFCAERGDCPAPEKSYKLNKNDLESETPRIVILA